MKSGVLCADCRNAGRRFYTVFGRIIIPQAVDDEVTANPDPACIQIKNNTDWIQVETITDVPDRKMYKTKLQGNGFYISDTILEMALKNAREM